MLKSNVLLERRLKVMLRNALFLTAMVLMVECLFGYSQSDVSS